MDLYEQQIGAKLALWQKEMLRRPSIMNWLSKGMQTKINSWIPEKVHKAITATIKQMIRGVLFGAKHTTARPLVGQNLKEREAAVEKKIDVYKTTAAVEGGITGAGGILLGLADFPILIGIKLKLLFDIASLYGFDVNDYKERVYLLHIFELAFSSHEHRRNVYLKMVDWKLKIKELPEDIHQFDWRNFQQEYRDYIDLAKMAQLIPIIGAPVGAVVNSRLIRKLGHTAMNAYRMRLLEEKKTDILSKVI
ncbi:MAG TPA: EcsC family protein [Prolixibacteraceae bacterium]|nr:EcsC family protein [Prolixibacteraceae bacterium]